jgi:hypothetical protein
MKLFQWNRLQTLKRSKARQAEWLQTFQPKWTGAFQSWSQARVIIGKTPGEQPTALEVHGYA